MKPCKIEIYCDGAYSQAHKVGAYGVVFNAGKVIEFSDAMPDVSIARMELLGAVVALETLKLKHATLVSITSDSRYVVDGANTHINKWIANGWQTCQKARVTNKDLWLRALACCAKFTVTWHWVKGHTGDVHNERADFLASKALSVYLQENP